VLTVRQSKFGKSGWCRCTPITTAALRSYLRLRDRLHPQPATTAVFVSPADTRCCIATCRRRSPGSPARPGCNPGRHTS